MNILALPDLNKLVGLPELASENGQRVDDVMNLVTWVMLVLFVGWSCYLVYTVWRFRAKKNQAADYVGLRGHTTTHIEIGVVLVEVILLLGFAFPYWAMQVDKDQMPVGKDVVRVRVMGEAFKWTFQYAGEDGVLGRSDLYKVSPETAVGIDLDDPNAQDDFENPTLKVPKDRPIILEVTSKDVIHNLSLVTMRISMDAIPGEHANIWFLPIKIGDSDIICGQLCGAGHGVMKGVVEVVTEKDWDAWNAKASKTKFDSNQAKQKTKEVAVTGAR